ncbi:putative nucleotide-binding protein containing TIR-like domain protein [Pelagimonas phthalicica]|uniref:Putative nucleotide-binding protein containing TIR-like domain protein n=1 Tax=Pelagimonas phthalicica TaxID=1037362 RepID=A0A238JHH9_9RHOB|nr:nucleotide-binding protein [Pelagimonas phthalicica]TDS89961.1 putative nucleotide-binding protein with TIR-like domain [Pelagimonas phthalicica]SMX30128.1 putative nucleotide-binding protein containing TIR-like domain protein [Pelagimonas phthalicica]
MNINCGIEPEFSLENVLGQLQVFLNRGTALSVGKQGAQHHSWYRETRDFLAEYFSDDAVRAYFEAAANYSEPDVYVIGGDTVYGSFDKPTALKALRTVIRNAAAYSKEEEEEEDNGPLPSDKVFIVHGHDHAIRSEVSLCIQRLGLRSVVLSEQTDKGRTIIEKFEDNSNVGFAVVLMTGDDVGGNKGTPAENLKRRARQNVVLELGYFSAKLGRSKVCVLYEDGVELPSDFSGVIYKPIDSAGAWKYELTRELKDAGFEVSLDDLHRSA